MISVLVGIHRIDEFSILAIESILAQQNVAFELLIVCNGKNAGSIYQSLLQQYAQDPRARLFQSPIAQLSHALNIALSHAQFDYIARMDADDIAHPQRLSRQLAFLQEKRIDIVGSAVRLIDAQGQVLGQRTPTQGSAINRVLPFKNTFIHPSVLMRKQVLLDVGGYCGGFNSEDYDLWLRLRRKGVRWDNLPDFLLDYRVHGAASQRRLLGYAEVAGLMTRELVLSKNPLWFFAILWALLKGLLRAR